MRRAARLAVAEKLSYLMPHQGEGPSQLALLEAVVNRDHGGHGRVHVKATMVDAETRWLERNGWDETRREVGVQKEMFVGGCWSRAC